MAPILINKRAGAGRIPFVRYASSRRRGPVYGDSPSLRSARTVCYSSSSVGLLQPDPDPPPPRVHTLRIDSSIPMSNMNSTCRYVPVSTSGTLELYCCRPLTLLRTNCLWVWSLSDVKNDLKDCHTYRRRRTYEGTPEVGLGVVKHNAQLVLILITVDANRGPRRKFFPAPHHVPTC